jgi:hypothetical protein
MVAAHENAAKCLESGKSGEVCEKALQAACKGQDRHEMMSTELLAQSAHSRLPGPRRTAVK